jgi:uncharacterized membrane protein YfcA
MHTPTVYLFLIFWASLLAGAMNAVAGGGTLVAFPSLLFAGVAPVVANATTSLGLWPSAATGGWVYRKEITTPKKVVLALVGSSILGGFTGAWLLLHTPDVVFHELIPPLLLFASTLFTLSGRVRRMAERTSLSTKRLAAFAVVGQFGVAIYGGYFGAAMGVFMLALFSLTLGGTIHSMNGVRTWCGTAVNTTAIVVFLFGHRIDWPIAGVMAAGAIVGGVTGAMCMRRLNPLIARRIVLAVAWTMTIVYIAKMGL